jgi:hypothetical protein
VLSTGKYLNVIQQCDKSAQWAALQSLEYLPNSEHYHPIIEKVFLCLIVLNLKICIGLSYEIDFKNFDKFIELGLTKGRGWFQIFRGSDGL